MKTWVVLFMGYATRVQDRDAFFFDVSIRQANLGFIAHRMIYSTLAVFILSHRFLRKWFETWRCGLCGNSLEDFDGDKKDGVHWYHRYNYSASRGLLSGWKVWRKINLQKTKQESYSRVP